MDEQYHLSEFVKLLTKNSTQTPPTAEAVPASSHIWHPATSLVRGHRMKEHRISLTQTTDVIFLRIFHLRCTSLSYLAHGVDSVCHT